MDRWRQRRYDGWLDLAAHLLASSSGRLPRDLLLDELVRTFGCAASFTVFEGQHVQSFIQQGNAEPFTDEDDEYWRTDRGRSHPLVQWYARSGEHTPQTLGRVPPSLAPAAGRARLMTRLRELGVDQQLALPCRTGPTSWTFAVGRTGSDFTEQELELARSLQPLLAVVGRQASLAVPVPRSAGAGLTAREHSVLVLLAEGHTAQAIARRLGTSPRTVHKHLEHVYRKLGVRDRLGAFRVASEAGLVPAPRRPTDEAAP